MVKDFLSSLREKVAVTDQEEENISHNLDRLFDLQKYPFTALEIAPTVDEEQVADIFVRINSEGVKLNQADFILTLLSVFWDEGRKELEQFCRAARQPTGPGMPASSFNQFIRTDPDQLLRVAIALGFERGRLKSVYQVLRGKDLDTGIVTAEKREHQFAVLREAQAKVLDLTNWHQFLSALVGAGFRSGEMISSKNALLYAYAFYLIGRTRFGVAEHRLQKAIGRWFFFASLTGRYTSSPETVMDADLNRLKNVKDAESLIETLDALISLGFTNDFWTTTLPAAMDSSSARNPALFAYTAAQNRLNAPVLFSHKYVSDLLDPALRTKKKPLERHHLFPRKWLSRIGVDDLKQVNQMANQALIEWPENIDISAKSPAYYVPEIKKRFPESDWQRMHELHGLPMEWEQMEYADFLVARRRFMADIIRRGYRTLI